MLYLVTATVVKKKRMVVADGVGWQELGDTTIVKLPTFILHTAILRICNVEHAKVIATEMLKSIAADGSEVSVDVYELDEVVGVEGVGRVES